MRPQDSAKRAHHSKARTGCGTCKRRHVKCDESRPTCLQCRKAKRQCSGYALEEVKRTANSQIEQLQPQFFRNSFDNSPPMPSRLSCASYSSSECSAYDFFRSKTVTLLSGNLPSKVWSDTVLRIAESAEEVKHCIIALGCWHAHSDKQILLDTHTMAKFCLKHYGLALKHFQTTIIKDTVETSLTAVALLTCMLLTVLECVFGNQNEVHLHLKYGLKLANRTKNRTTSSFERSIQFHLGYMGLSSQMLLVRAEDAVKHGDLLQDLSLCQTNYDGLTLCNFRLLNLGNNVYRFIFRLGAGLFHDSQSQNLAHMALRQEAQYCEDSVQTESSRSPNSARICLMEARCELFRVLLEASPSHHQTSYDQYFHSFSKIIDLVENVLLNHDAATATEFADTISSISMDLGIVPLLYYTAIYCRHGSIRRKAISLLGRGPMIEGIWRARYAKAVAEAVVDLEENGAVPHLLDQPGYIPEGDRVHLAFFEADQSLYQTSDTITAVLATRPTASERRLTMTSHQIYVRS